MTANSYSCATAQEHAWALLLAARDLIDSAEVYTGRALHYDPFADRLSTHPVGTDGSDLTLGQNGQWTIGRHLNSTVMQMLQFYLPVLGAPDDRSRVIAHLGQSVDARIATTEGDSYFVTGPENRRHLHCLRALCHAVIVGAGTVEADNPRLTTRAVTGKNPIRVVIDPQARLSVSSGVYTDGQSPTLLIHDAGINSASLCEEQQLGSQVKCIPIDFEQEALVPSNIVSALSDLGLSRLFIEGGGVTISRFMQAGCVDRLQIACAPLLVGEGRRSLQLPGIDRMVDALRPPFNLYRMGEDVLWDFDVSASAERRRSQIVYDGKLPSAQQSDFELLF